MTPITIINRYILKELLQPFLLCLGFLSLVFLLTKIIDITDLVVNYRASLSTVLAMVGYTLPVMMQYTLPMSVMMAVLLTLLRMSADQEVVAIKAGGAGLSAIFYPVGAFCLLGSLLTLAVTVYAVPWGNYSYKKMVVNIASAGVDASIKEGTFNTNFDGVMLYVERINPEDKSLHGVFIRDTRNPESEVSITAPRGVRFFSKQAETLTLRLFNGEVNQVNLVDRAVNAIGFSTYDIRVNFGKLHSDKSLGNKARDEMSLSELSAYIASEKKAGRIPATAIMEINEKFALALAAFTLGILSISLGLRSAFSRKSSGMGLGLVCFLLYYVMHAAGWSLGKSGVLAPELALWVGNIVMGSAGLIFLARVAREKTLGFDVLGGFFLSLFRWAMAPLRKGGRS
ncbi:LPS export ABC transporter permease LptF [Desulfoluna sp.]|uniref:LPS export ABC transporter permease LptF n=1 Tax=Desulfoluna sp. TaxID=2045199 RepID=UPI002614B5AC|nr:LPS export ABC transporter permease LptF [Desulfoluna sp.]